MAEGPIITAGPIHFGGALDGNFDISLTRTSSGVLTSDGHIIAGTGSVAVASPNDLFSVADGNYGFFSLTGSSNADVGFALNQGNTNGTAGNGFTILGIVGTNADINYGLSTSASGRNSGDFICQTFFSSAFRNIFYVPHGTNSVTHTNTLFCGTQAPTANNSNQDLLNVSDGAGNYGYASLNAQTAGGNVGLALIQGAATGASSNNIVTFGIVGAHSDPAYGLSTAVSGLNSGDIVCQTFFSGSFRNIWHIPVGTNSFVIGASALSTPATDGFLYIPSCAGTPSGTPTAQTGRVPMIYDTTNNKFYIYNSGWKGGTTPGAFT